MSVIYISLIMIEQSLLIENTLLKIDVPLEEAAAFEFREELENWMQKRPIPGQPKSEIPTDQASLLALELPHILGSRDPKLFSPYYLDREGDLSRIDHRPYDWTRLEPV